MERAVWIFACIIALSLALGLSSLSSATSVSRKDSSSYKLDSCKTKCKILGEMFLRKARKAPRKAYA